MPTATEPVPHEVGRRVLLQRLGLGAVALLAARPSLAARHPAATVLAACWDDARTGQHRAGWLRLEGPTRAASVRVLQAFDLPTRGHGLALLPDGSLLVAARRPGDWLVRLSPRLAPQWVWMEAGRVFSGHVLAGPDGCTVFTTEIDTDTGQGLLGVRDARSLAKTGEYPTHGMDPHAVSLMPAPEGQGAGHALAGMLLVANGGIDTAAETGRTKRHLHRMDPSVACLNPATGECLGQWRLPDPRLSLRHLAWAQPPAGPPVLGIALQAEHDEAAIRAAAPLLAVLDWQHRPEGELRLASGQPPWAGYGGDVAAVSPGPGEAPQWVVSATRGHALVRYALDGQCLGHTPWPDAGALTKGRVLWAGGRDGALHPAQAPGTADATAPFAPGRLDNHWLSVSTA